MSERVNDILKLIDDGLADADPQADADQLRSIEDDVWAVLDDAVERGDYSMDVALARYRGWHNAHCLGALATTELSAPTPQPLP